MKKKLALLLALVMIVALAVPVSASAEPAESITLWTYPIGNWGDEATVKELTDAFTAETGIAVTVEYLTYADGDDKVNTAITAKQAPDLIMEGPERLVSNWGANGYMVDISDLFDDTDKSEINAAALKACFAPDGAAYEYPLVMTAHCMAVNVNALEEAGVKDLVDLESHTWTTEQFFEVVKALNETYGIVGAVYCNGQGGDQGTRALVNSLYGGTFTNEDHTAYTWDNEKNIEALKALYDTEGIDYDPSIVGGDEIANFYNGIFKMAFCWNIAQQLNPNSAGTGAGLTMSGDEIGFMAFPSQDGVAALQGGIWGFGVFDNKDEARANAAKEFIKFLTEDDGVYAKVVEATNFQPVRDVEGVYEGNELMAEYALMNPMMGDYYQITKGWTTARTEWWNMLQRVGESDGTVESILTEMTQAQDAANAAAAAE